MKNSIPGIFTLAFCTFAFTSCTLLKATPAERSGFLREVPKMDEAPERAPFHRTWAKREARAKDYFDSIYFRPIDTSIIYQIPEEKRPASPEEIQTISEYMMESFKRALIERADSGIRVMEEPVSSTLVIELALTELEPTSVSLNVAGGIAGNIVPGSGLLAGSLAKGKIAMEFKVYNSKGELLGAAGDRESDVSSIANLNDYTRLGHAKRRIEEWAKQFAELIATSPEHVVEDSSGFTLLPW